MGKLDKIRKNNGHNSYKGLVERKFQQMIKAIKIEKGDPESVYAEGDYAQSRKNAVLNTLRYLESDLISLDKNNAINEFVEHEFIPYGTYEDVEISTSLYLSAALWLILQLRNNGKLTEANELIFNLGENYLTWCLPPDFGHPCFSNDFINTIASIIATRNSFTGKAGELISIKNAKRIKADNLFIKLAELLPEEVVDKACKTFKDKIYEIALRFTKGALYFSSESERLKEQGHQTLMSALNASHTSFAGAPVYDIDELVNADVFTQNIISTQPQRVAESFMTTFSAHKIGSFEASYNQLCERRNDFYMNFSDYLSLDKEQLLAKVKYQEIADCLADFTISDPYELCFALFYLIDKGDDAPWLISSGYNLMKNAVKMLPWYVDKSEWESKDYDIWFNNEVVYNQNNWLEQKPADDEVNYFQIKHKGRNLTQLIYDMCHIVIPTGMHPFEKDCKKLIEEGMEPELAKKITGLSEMLFFSEFQIQHSPSADFDLDNDDEDFDSDYEDNDDDDLNWAYPEEDCEEDNDDDDGDRVEELSNQVESYKDEVSSLKQQLKSLKKSLAVSRQEQMNEKTKYEQELKALRLEHRELADLREIVFSQNSDQADKAKRETLEQSYSYPYSTRKNMVIFGGHDSWLKVIKPMLPDVKFVDAAQYAFNQDIIKNADVVWVQSNCLSHAQFANIIGKVRLYGVQLRYFGYSSAEKCAEQLVTEDLAS